MNISQPQHQQAGDASLSTFSTLSRKIDKRKTSIILLATLVLSVLVFATLGTLFLVRRSVTFNITVPVGNYTFELVKPRVPFLLSINVEAQNDNFFSIDLRNATITATHPLYNEVLGRGSLAEITLYKRKRTSFSIDFWLVYDPIFDTEGLFIGAIVRNCTSEVSEQGIYADAKVEADFVTWIKSGHISEERDLFVPC